MPPRQITAKPVTEYNALDLLKAWRHIVNDKALAGRDGHLLKEFLKQASPIQILVGMYDYRNEKGLSVPAFLNQSDEWLIDDENEALIQCAIRMTDSAPPEYWIWCDYRDEESAYALEESKKALKICLDWAKRIVG